MRPAILFLDPVALSDLERGKYLRAVPLSSTRGGGGVPVHRHNRARAGRGYGPGRLQQECGTAGSRVSSLVMPAPSSANSRTESKRNNSYNIGGCHINWLDHGEDKVSEGDTVSL